MELEEVVKKIENKKISRRDFLKLLGGLGGLAALAAGYKAIKTFIPISTSKPTHAITPPPTYTPAHTPTPKPTSTRTSTPTVTPTPPEITEVAFEPTRVVNDKVYDGLVRAVIEDPDQLVDSVELVFEPVDYPHLPPDAFPGEATREIALRPVDGEFDESKKEFVAEITDIIGGREYEVKVFVKDKAENVSERRLTTPYIREFEKIVSDYLFGANYMTFWGIHWKNSPAGRWEEIGTVLEPILGKYSSNDEIVINRHIDEVEGHGIRLFSLDFGWIRPFSPFDRVARKHVLQSELADSLKFNITYHSDAVVGKSWSKGPSALRSDFSFLAEHYFNHPSYHKVNGEPSVIILNVPWYWREFGIKGTNDLFNELEEWVKDKYGHELFLVAGIWPDANPSFLNDPGLPFDAILNCGNLWHTIGTDKATYEEYVNNYAAHWGRWATLAEKRGIDFIPLIHPGFDNKPYADNTGQEHHYITRDPERYTRLLQVAKEVTTPPLNMIMIRTYNDHHEGSSIEPTREYGFTYLDAIAQQATE